MTLHVLERRRAEPQTGNPSARSQPSSISTVPGPRHSLWASVSLWLRPSLAAPALPPSTSHTGQIVHKKRSQGSLSSLERPHKCKALLASLLLNINNDIIIVHYKPEKKLQEPCVETAKRIIRPLRAAGPFRPSRKIRKANVSGVLRFPFRPPAQFNLAPPGPTRIMLCPVPRNPCQKHVPHLYTVYSSSGGTPNPSTKTFAHLLAPAFPPLSCQSTHSPPFIHPSTDSYLSLC